MKRLLLALVLALAAAQASAQLRILSTTFPIYQIARNVVGTEQSVALELMLPPSLGCPHDYALTPRDMRKLARADILIVNGHGLEEFLGAPVRKANEELRLLDSSAGITELLELEPDPHADPYEWTGCFELQTGSYRWTFAQVDGEYADPSIILLMLPAPSGDKSGLEALAPFAAERFEAEALDRMPGAALRPAPTPYRLHFDEESPVTSFEILIEDPGFYAFFTEHFPFEFQADEHFLKDARGQDLEPLAQHPESGTDHAHHHEGINPHLWVSPRLNAMLAQNIARALGALVPEAAPHFQRNAEEYAARMERLLAEMRAAVEALPNRRIVQPHGVFDYLARDLGLEIVASTQPHGLEPSAAEMLRLLDVIRQSNVAAIVTEPQYSPRVGRTLAAEAGIPVVMLDPAASGPDNAPLDHYENVMRANLALLRAALGADE